MISFRLQSALAIGLWATLGMMTHLAARAGGAGGRSSGSHGSHGGSYHGGSHSFGGASHYSSGGAASNSSNSTSGLIVFFLFLVIIAIAMVVAYRKNKNSSNYYNPPPPLPPTQDSIAKFLATHPDFNMQAFMEKVHAAFMKIQSAWSAMDVSSVRPFITDGIYQRFTTQFRMMSLLKQRNILDEINILSVTPVSASIDGPYEVIDVMITASMHDQFSCGTDPSLDTESDDTFVEYWSFIRKRREDETTQDIYQHDNCPSCGAPLSQSMGELCQCAYCHVMINSGEFDWILTEITQQQDYGDGSSMAHQVSPDCSDHLALLDAECADFSVQMAEDKASNAFMQIMTAIATRNPASVRRFVTDGAYATVESMISERTIIFDRIYLNESVFLDAGRVGNKHRISVGLASSMQRVEILPDNRLRHIDGGIVRNHHILVMERDADAVPAKGSLYQHQCASCGGAVGDTVDVQCQYCGTPLNSTRNEWIVAEILTPS